MQATDSTSKPYPQVSQKRQGWHKGETSDSLGPLLTVPRKQLNTFIYLFIYCCLRQLLINYDHNCKRACFLALVEFFFFSFFLQQNKIQSAFDPASPSLFHDLVWSKYQRGSIIGEDSVFKKEKTDR